jgi:hypothetical protein
MRLKSERLQRESRRRSLEDKRKVLLTGMVSSPMASTMASTMVKVQRSLMA